MLAVVLAGLTAYAATDGSRPASIRMAGEVWPVGVDESKGIVILAKEDFEAIVRAYNLQNAELHRMRRGGGCR